MPQFLLHSVNSCLAHRGQLLIPCVKKIHSRQLSRISQQTGGSRQQQHAGLVTISRQQQHAGLVTISRQQQHAGLVGISRQQQHAGLVTISRQQQHAGLVGISRRQQHAGLASQADISKDYAFEMTCSNIRFGLGITQEVGMDLKNMKANNVCLMTDPNMSSRRSVQVARESLEKAGITYHFYDQVEVEPTDVSFNKAIQFARLHEFDAYLAVGGGSVIDTCKVANLYSCNPAAELLDYVNAPVGKGLPVTHQLKPLIAVPTTAGTGSETTGVAIFDYLPMKAKTGIASRVIRPTLGVIDPLNTLTCPDRVTTYCGLDVLCHAIESFTAKPFDERTPRPEDPLLRPAYQGANPISDIWSLKALRMMAANLQRAVSHPDDIEARSAMHLASCYAGIGFGNAGCHLPHGMSYPISGLVDPSFRAEGYDVDHALVPHGLSVIITAPAVFEFTAPGCPQRHLDAAEILGADVKNVRLEDAGKVIGEALRKHMYSLNMPDGLQALGYTSSDIPALVKGTLPQQRVTKLSPRAFTPDDLAAIFEASMKNY